MEDNGVHIRHNGLENVACAMQILIVLLVLGLGACMNQGYGNRSVVTDQQRKSARESADLPRL
ncbi:MAG: hypothetical protein QNJ46_19095 [Leptolyngbyaceae cyanobacterium MO_188.B28]|nr:hypothetical protein [Leptolyngbyaceae cyanobacterium MO_188.B28]